MKKISVVSPLAVIIAMVIVFGLIGVSVGDNIPEIIIEAPGSEVNNSSIIISGFIADANETPDESITNATLTYGGMVETLPIDKGRFSCPITLSPGKNKLTIKIETESGPLSSIHEVTYNPPPTTPTEKAEETKKEGVAIPNWVIPATIVVLIVVLSFLIFFVIEEKTRIKAEIAWVITALSAVFISFVLFYLGEQSLRFEFGYLIIAILLSTGLPFLYLFKDNLFKSSEGSTRERELGYGYFNINFKLFDEKTNQPISDALIVVSGGDLLDPRRGHTDPSGYCDHRLKRGEYNYSIESVGGYKSKSEAFSVESDRTFSIHLSKRTGNLVVQVKDSETGNPIQGANVNVSGAAKTTDEQGKALFSGLSIGAKEIIVDEITGVYSSGRITGVIEEDATTETSVPIKSLLQIPTDKRNKLKALGSQLQDNYRRVSTYDPCIPFYYKSSVDNMVNLIEGMVDEPMLFVGAKNPGETIGYLVDAVDLASREITEVMTLKRNVDVYSAAMGLEKAEVKAKPVGFGDSRVKDYIRDAGDFYNSYYHSVQSKLFNIDTTITRKTGEMNILPVSGLWRVARTLLNETASSSADSIKKSAMLLIADFILDYADDMLKEPQIIERLKLMVL